MDRAPAPCPDHPSQTAFVECRNCGRPACAYCLDAGPGDVCEACFADDEKRGLIAFERGDLSPPLRFFRTFRQVLRESGETFVELGPGPVGPALAWAAICWALSTLLSFVVVSPFVALMSAGFVTALPIGELSPVLFSIACCGGPLVQSLSGVVAAFVAALVFHGAASALGGEGELSAAVRATGYAQAVVVVWGPLTLTMLLPQLGLIVACIAFVGQLAWGASVLVTVARAHHGLRGGRAVVAGALPSILAAVSLAALLTLSWLAADAASPDLSPDRYQESPARYGD